MSAPLLRPRALQTVGAGWLLIMGTLWLVTNRDVPVVHVRWAPGVAPADQSALEGRWNLVPTGAVDERTGRYLALATDPASLRAIVAAPEVEDTAFIDRPRALLEARAPVEPYWLGRRYPLLVHPLLLWLAAAPVLSALLLRLRQHAVLFLHGFPTLGTSRKGRDFLNATVAAPHRLVTFLRRVSSPGRLAGLIFVVSLLAFMSAFSPDNDHYDRLARARQIAQYGEMPFRDFFDPGYFLTLYASALMQRLFGDTLLGEALLNCFAMAGGTWATVRLACRLGLSMPLSGIAAAMVVISQPRFYDYDKIFFLPTGLLLVWNYIDRPNRGTRWSMAAVGVAGGLFRYDTGLYLGVGALLSIAVRHWGQWPTLMCHLRRLVAASALLLAPALVFIHVSAGLPDAADQIWRYAVTEGKRTWLLQWPTFQFALRRDDAVTWLYWLAVLTPIGVCLRLMSVRSYWHRERVARLLSLAVVAEISAQVILRDPVDARVAGVMPLTAVGAIWLWAEWASQILKSGSGRLLSRALLGAVVLLTAVSLAARVRIPGRIGPDLSLTDSPVNTSWLPAGRLTPLVTYLRSCTRADDRILVTWFAPEVYFFSGRPFAAGLPALFGRHWSEPRDQDRSIRQLQRYPPTVVLTNDPDGVHSSHPRLWSYLATHYREVKAITLQDALVIHVWMRHEHLGTTLDVQFGLPCLSGSHGLAQSAP